MKITPRNILRHELIGLPVTVVESSNKYQVGIRGVVADETMKTIVIRTDKGLKMVPKEGSYFLFRLPRGIMVKVEGRQLLGRPEDRLKKKVYYW